MTKENRLGGLNGQVVVMNLFNTRNIWWNTIQFKNHISNLKQYPWFLYLNLNQYFKDYKLLWWVYFSK